MKPRVLIVEDDEDLLEGNETDLLQISKDRKDHIGIEGFVIDKAMTKEEAMDLLKKALDTSSLYDLLLLDMSLPLNKAMLRESPERGLEILGFAHEKGAAKGIIVASVFSQYEYVVQAFRGGAVDFIAKPYDQATLQVQVLKYFEKEGARLLEQRVKDLILYAEKRLAHRLSKCFSDFSQSVMNEIEGLKEGFRERWGLDVERDSQDSQGRHLIALKDAVRNAMREWREIQYSLVSKNDESEEPNVRIAEELLSEIKVTVAPCLALKKVNLILIMALNQETKVRTFGDNVKPVLKEIILGALSDLVNYDNSPKKIEVSVKKDEIKGRAEVSFKDNLDPIESEAARLINEGVSLPSGPGFGRAWGLSVVQHIAMRDGGKLEIESSEEGNIITYSIPLADHV